MSPPDLRAEEPLDPRRTARRVPAADHAPQPEGGPPRREKPARAKRRRRGIGLFRLLFMVLVVGGLVAWWWFAGQWATP